MCVCLCRVQVWFQNARAKEKKAVSPDGVPGGAGAPAAAAPSLVSAAAVPDACRLCAVHYSSQLTAQDHLFTRMHIDRVKAAVCGQQRDVAGGSDSSSSVPRSRRYSSSKTAVDDLHSGAGRARPAASSAAGLLLTPPPIAAVPSSNGEPPPLLSTGLHLPPVPSVL